MAPAPDAQPDEPDEPDEPGGAGAVVGWVVHGVGLVPLLVGPAVVTLLARAVGTGGDPVDAFVSAAVFATGVAACVALVRTRALGRVSGLPLLALAAACLLGGLALATLVHMQAFSSLPGSTTVTGTPADLPAIVTAAALASWGWSGGVVAAVSGVLAGVWGVRFVAALG